MNGMDPSRDPAGPAMDARLRALHEISMELSRAADADSLCKRAVELCVLRLGFDRVGIWFLDPEDARVFAGTWGTDESGRPRDERALRFPIRPEDCPKELYGGEAAFLIVDGDRAADERLRPAGRCDKAIAPLREGSEIVGEMIADNLFGGRPIGEEDGEVLALFARTVAQLCALKRGEAALRLALAEKALLLSELRHRTMNAFAMMGSLVSIESSRAEDAERAGTLLQIRDRIGVMASLYRQLDVMTGHEKVRLDAYLGALAAELMKGYGAETRSLSLECDLEAAVVDMKRAVPLGLIVNELVTNSLKHGFPEARSGTVALKLRREDEACTIRVSDDGVGLPADFTHPSSRGLGLALVDSLCRQIGARLEAGPGPRASFAVRFGA
jgi:two-component sensor histidine kinase